MIECAGGLLLAFVSTDATRQLVDLLTQSGLVHGPADFVAPHLLALAQ